MPDTPPSLIRTLARRLGAQPVAAGLLMAALAAVLAWAWQQRGQAAQAAERAQAEQQARERGRLLFERGEGLPARMAGHADGLPPMASRCINCHAVTAVAATAGVDSAPSPARAPAAAAPLGGTWLTELRPRRGGPPSRFDAAALCSLLSTGRDPAGVVVNVSMPRYTASAAQCQDLWAYLSTVAPAAP
jgi:hypothetical protein